MLTTYLVCCFYNLLSSFSGTRAGVASWLTLSLILLGPVSSLFFLYYDVYIRVRNWRRRRLLVKEVLRTIKEMGITIVD